MNLFKYDLLNSANHFFGENFFLITMIKKFVWKKYLKNTVALLQRKFRRVMRWIFKERQIGKINSVLWTSFLFLHTGSGTIRDPSGFRLALSFILIITITRKFHFPSNMYNKYQIKTPQEEMGWRMGAEVELGITKDHSNNYGRKTSFLFELHAFIF